MAQLTKSQEQFINEMSLEYKQDGLMHTFKNTDNQLIFCAKDMAYTLIYGEYTIDHHFELPFNTMDRQLRFGLVYEGASEFRFKDNSVTHFFPSSFIAIEDHLSGVHNLKKGYHYRGIEIFVNVEYIKLLEESYPELKTLHQLPTNHAILYLPTQVGQVLNYLACMMKKKELTSLMLEAKLLESLSIIAKELNNTEDKPFFNLINSGVFLTQSAKLSMSDIEAIQKVHETLKDQLSNPPSISKLAKDLFIGEQKLMMGFKDMYQMTIGSYIQETRLNEAANFLSTTDLSIDEISRMVGYNHPSNFGKAFKKKFNRSPLQYRKFNQRK